MTCILEEKKIEREKLQESMFAFLLIYIYIFFFFFFFFFVFVFSSVFASFARVYIYKLVSWLTIFKGDPKDPLFHSSPYP